MKTIDHNVLNNISGASFDDFDSAMNHDDLGSAMNHDNTDSTVAYFDYHFKFIEDYNPADYYSPSDSEEDNNNKD